jgi:hypothetical protein
MQVTGIHTENKTVQPQNNAKNERSKIELKRCRTNLSNQTTTRLNVMQFLAQSYAPTKS